MVFVAKSLRLKKNHQQCISLALNCGEGRGGEGFRDEPHRHIEWNGLRIRTAYSYTYIPKDRSGGRGCADASGNQGLTAGAAAAFLGGHLFKLRLGLICLCFRLLLAMQRSAV